MQEGKLPERNGQMELKERIQNLRKEKGLSQDELAGLLGIARQSVSKWESGISQPDLNNIVRLSEIFEVSTDYLLKGEEPEAVFVKETWLTPRKAAVMGTVLNACGMILSLVFWMEWQDWRSYAAGLILPVLGTAVFCLGNEETENRQKKAEQTRRFWKVNVWLVSFVPFCLVWSGAVMLVLTHSFWSVPWPGILPMGSQLIFWIVWAAGCLLAERKLQRPADPAQPAL